jgi:hypothetical protein
MHQDIKLNSEAEILRHALKISGEDAYHAALNQGVAVTVLKGNKIQRIQPDGKKTTVGTISKASKKVLPARVRIK